MFLYKSFSEVKFLFERSHDQLSCDRALLPTSIGTVTGFSNFGGTTDPYQLHTDELAFKLFQHAKPGLIAICHHYHTSEIGIIQR